MLGWAPTKVESIIFCSISSQAMGESSIRTTEPLIRNAQGQRRKKKGKQQQWFASTVTILVGHPRQKHKWAFRHRIGQPIRKAGVFFMLENRERCCTTGWRRKNKHNLATLSASLKKNEVKETKKRASLKEDYMGNVPWRRCGVVKQPPQLIRCQKQKKNANEWDTKQKKMWATHYENDGWGGSHRANVCVLLETMPAKKSICSACAQLKHITMMRTKKHKKIMPQGNRKNKRKRRTKGTKVQGRRKEHLSVLGETTTAQYESACFLDAARPQIKKIWQQSNNKTKEKKQIWLRQLGCGTCSATRRTRVWSGIGNLKCSYPPPNNICP